MSDRILAAQVAVLRRLQDLRDSESGQGATEYAGALVIAALLVGGFVAAADGLGDNIKESAQKAIEGIIGQGK